MTTDEDVKVIDYNLRVHGVFGRNRKEKYKSFKISRVPEAEDGSFEGHIKLALEKLEEIKPKPGLRWRLARCPVTLEKRKGYVTESFILMSDTMVAEGRV